MPSGTIIKPSYLHHFGAFSLCLLFAAPPGLAAADVIVHGGGSSYHTAEPYPAEATAMIQIFSEEALRSLAAPIALYPDDLLALVLPAATHPRQIVEAARFLADLESNPDQVPNEAWDPTVVALLNYPEVLQLLNADLSWTRDLGQATLNQEAELIAAIEAFRQEAYAAGNLSSDHRLLVEEQDGALEIRPAHPQVIYVPYYDPNQVLLRQTTEVYHYYPRPYPVYYYPYAADDWFTSGWFWGVRHSYHIGWRNRHVYLNRPYAENRYHRKYGDHRYHRDYSRRHRAGGAYHRAHARRHMDQPNRRSSFSAGTVQPRQQRNPGARQAETGRGAARRGDARRGDARRKDASTPVAQRPGIQGPGTQRPGTGRPGIPASAQRRQQVRAATISRSTVSRTAITRSTAQRTVAASASAGARTTATPGAAASTVKARPGLPAGNRTQPARPGVVGADSSFGGGRGSQPRR